jgi:hypothetical protein
MFDRLLTRAVLFMLASHAIKNGAALTRAASHIYVRLFTRAVNGAVKLRS